MKRLPRFLTSLMLAASVAVAVAQSGPSSDAGKALATRIGKLRKLKDDDRRVETKLLAMEIRELPAGPEKLDLAFGLSNLSTEGDFGKDTLQAVTDTLVQAVKETPPARVHAKDAPSSDAGQPADEYDEIAQLAKYEHMSVDLHAPDFLEAVKNLNATDAKRAAADFTLTDMNGQSWTLSQLKGKVVIVNFWATWCPPCRKEMPDLDALYAKYKDQGLVILAISDEDDAVVKKFIDEKGYKYPILLDHGSVHKTYDVLGIPKNFVYDREGKMVAQSIDMRTMGQFLEMLKAAGIQ